MESSKTSIVDHTLLRPQMERVHVYTLKDLDGKVLKKKCNIKRLKVNMNVYS